ncbi:toxin-antitoxin system YwqK family antitoxin [Aurantibacter sp.]|uniref:toxin-antitoxin system YwqK family antitoxin n=1 Tax=Aurantibacter sp. TaxID=2807103 RepID=UPI0035C80B22
MKNLAFILVMLVVGLGYSQSDRTLTLNEKTNLIEVSYFHDNGQVSQTGFYTAEGKLQGEWITYDLQGTKKVSAKYDNGIKTGKWFYWSASSLKEVDYSNNTIATVSSWVNENTIADSKQP